MLYATGFNFHHQTQNVTAALLAILHQSSYLLYGIVGSLAAVVDLRCRKAAFSFTQRSLSAAFLSKISIMSLLPPTGNDPKSDAFFDDFIYCYL